MDTIGGSLCFDGVPFDKSFASSCKPITEVAMPRKLGEKTLQRIAEVQIQIDALKKKRYPDEYLTCFNKHLDVYKERIDKLWSYTLDIRATPDKQNAKNLGIKKYIWRTAGDSRVCARCAERD